LTVLLILCLEYHQVLVTVLL